MSAELIIRDLARLKDVGNAPSDGQAPVWNASAGKYLHQSILPESAIIAPRYGGTGINNGANTISVAGAFATVGDYPLTLNLTGATSLTLPASGTLATVAQIPAVAVTSVTQTARLTLNSGVLAYNDSGYALTGAANTFTQSQNLSGGLNVSSIALAGEIVQPVSGSYSLYGQIQFGGSGNSPDPFMGFVFPSTAYTDRMVFGVVNATNNYVYASISGIGKAVFDSISLSSGFTAGQFGTIEAQPGYFSTAAGFVSNGSDMSFGHYQALTDGTTVFNVDESGNLTTAGYIAPGSINTATTMGTVAGQLVYDTSGGANSGHWMGWNGSAWKQLELDN